jgi:NAD(P)-dependent dehydrogenase (short-subunit alcohol dehydrogenase family)
MNSVVVTGVGSGLGLAALSRLADDGYYVVGIEISDSGAAFAEGQLRGRGEILQGDVADRAVLATAAQRARANAPLTSWVNNAGIALSGNLHDPNPTEVDRVFAVNLQGMFWGCSEAIRNFLDLKVAGSIVNISSIHGRAAFPGWAAYDTAKGGVDALTRYVCVEYGPVGIRANAIAPGAIRTEMLQQVISDAPDPDNAEREFAIIHPLTRVGEASEIASVVAFLLSGESSFISGQSIAVDGGATARCFRFPPDAGLMDSMNLNSDGFPRET